MANRPANEPQAVGGYVGTDALTGAIDRHLDTLIAAQGQLQAVLDRKQSALIEADSSAIQRLAAEEERLAGEFAKLQRERETILQSATQAGVRATSLTELAVALDLPEATRRQIRDVRTVAEHLQRETWSQLIVASQSARHYDDLIGIIATGGEQDPTYHDTHEPPDTASGGNLLDAAA